MTADSGQSRRPAAGGDDTRAGGPIRGGIRALVRPAARARRAAGLGTAAVPGMNGGVDPADCHNFGRLCQGYRNAIMPMIMP